MADRVDIRSLTPGQMSDAPRVVDSATGAATKGGELLIFAVLDLDDGTQVRFVLDSSVGPGFHESLTKSLRDVLVLQQRGQN